MSVVVMVIVEMVVMVLVIVVVVAVWARPGSRRLQLCAVHHRVSVRVRV